MTTFPPRTFLRDCLWSPDIADIYLYHRLSHAAYNTCLSTEDKQQLSLR